MKYLLIAMWLFMSSAAVFGQSDTVRKDLDALYFSQVGFEGIIQQGPACWDGNMPNVVGVYGTPDDIKLGNKFDQALTPTNVVLRGPNAMMDFDPSIMTLGNMPLHHVEFYFRVEKRAGQNCNFGFDPSMIIRP